jgi:hypothetical protein
MPIVKQPSKLTFRSQKFSKQETAVFKLLLEENKASEIAKIMRLDEKPSVPKLRLLQKTGLKLL